ncbi:serine/threonine/tyrosine-interacting protein A-like [Stegodyphus dumicola]|uniref:serine/threonine/tyrosine-interacting protein A-like n=1 Tax=Stegodyphus dumicola TaxID=202533 RepID=UPI0015AB7A41|nr:serine/threonine/tyrosine-interacting protein A-like [Stegodyphus dumicola]
MCWNYSMKEMQEIIPGLFLGPCTAASKAKLQELQEIGITHIVCVRHHLEANFIEPQFPDKFVYTVLDIADAATTNIIPFFPQVKQFIDSCFKKGGKVLVHGNTGVSRSASLVIGYIMETFCLPYRDAFTLVLNKRLCICPNEGFMQQLKEYEPIYKAQKTLLNGHTSKVTGKLKRKYDESEDSDCLNNQMDVCDESNIL